MHFDVRKVSMFLVVVKFNGTVKGKLYLKCITLSSSKEKEHIFALNLRLIHPKENLFRLLDLVLVFQKYTLTCNRLEAEENEI